MPLGRTRPTLAPLWCPSCETPPPGPFGGQWNCAECGLVFDAGPGVGRAMVADLDLHRRLARLGAWAICSSADARTIQRLAHRWDTRCQVCGTAINCCTRRRRFHWHRCQLRAYHARQRREAAWARRAAAGAPVRQ